MKVLKLLLVGVLVLLLVCSSAQEHSEVNRKIENLLNGYYQQQQFSGSVLVAQKGKIVYQGAFGYADLNKGVENQIDTKFLIGSATKSFTAIAVLQLWEKGLLALHTPIKAYIPELNDTIGALSLHWLMKNASGLPVHLNRITALEYRDISSEELIQLYNTIDLAFTPGSKYEYSNLNYQLCALVIERVAEMSYKEYIEQHIFNPLQMTCSGIERTHSIVENKAKGYIIEEGQLVETPENYMAYAKGGGDIYSSVLDLWKWDQALYSDTLLGKAAKNLLFDGTPEQFGSYGYGFKIKHYQSLSNKEGVGKLVRHGGSMYGYICNIHRYLSDELTIIVLGNMRPYPTMEITKAIEAILLREN